MEKYARQAVSEGIKSPEDLHISGDSEIYRVLNLHYNRNNHIEVSVLPITQSAHRSICIVLCRIQSKLKSWIDTIFIIAFNENLIANKLNSPTFTSKIQKNYKKNQRAYTGTSSIPRSSWANITWIFPFHSKWQGYRTVLEEVHIQGHFPNGWFSSRIFQISEFPGATGIIDWPRRSNVYYYNANVNKKFVETNENKYGHTHTEKSQQGDDDDKKAEEVT